MLYDPSHEAWTQHDHRWLVPVLVLLAVAGNRVRARLGRSRGERTVGLLNPPVVNAELGIRQGVVNAATNVAAALQDQGVHTLVFAGSRTRVEELTQYLRERRDRKAARLRLDVVEVERLLQMREAARVKKDWKEADRLRAELGLLGVTLQDTGEGSTWTL